MSIRRRGTRQIRVGGAGYRWIVSRGNQAASGHVTVVLERIEGGGQRAAVRVPCRSYWTDYPDLVERGAYAPVTPGMVRTMIVAALGLGWRPNEKATPCGFQWTKDGRLGRIGSK